MIKYMRTSNAGGLLEMDGVKILLDGVCQAKGDYLATPPDIQNRLYNTPLDMMAFTHSHADHFQPEFVRQYARLHPLPEIVGPEDVAADLAEFPVTAASSAAEPVQVIAVPSRHIGVGNQELPHYSFILEGSAQICFMGDASPIQWQNQAKLPYPDLLIAPYAYAATESAWHITEHLAPKTILLTHLPSREQDSAQLWPAVDCVLAHHPEYTVLIPEMGEMCIIK